MYLEGPFHTATTFQHQVHSAPLLSKLLCNARGLRPQLLIQRKHQVLHLIFQCSQPRTQMHRLKHDWAMLGS